MILSTFSYAYWQLDILLCELPASFFAQFLLGYIEVIEQISN